MRVYGLYIKENSHKIWKATGFYNIYIACLKSGFFPTLVVTNNLGSLFKGGTLFLLIQREGET